MSNNGRGIPNWLKIQNYGTKKFFAELIFAIFAIINSFRVPYKKIVSLDTSYARSFVKFQITQFFKATAKQLSSLRFSLYFLLLLPNFRYSVKLPYKTKQLLSNFQPHFGKRR